MLSRERKKKFWIVNLCFRSIMNEAYSPHTILRDFFKIYSLVDAGSNGPFETHRCHPTRVVGDSRDGWARNGPRPALPSVHININKKKGGSFDRWSLVIELKWNSIRWWWRARRIAVFNRPAVMPKRGPSSMRIGAWAIISTRGARVCTRRRKQKKRGRYIYLHFERR